MLSVDRTTTLPFSFRLPRAGLRDPYFGQSRSGWNEIILPSAANGGNPPVQSFVRRKPGKIRGSRFILYQSAREFFEQLAALRSSIQSMHLPHPIRHDVSRGAPPGHQCLPARVGLRPERQAAVPQIPGQPFIHLAAKSILAGVCFIRDHHDVLPRAQRGHLSGRSEAL